MCWRHSWLGVSLGLGGLVAMIVSSAVTTGVGVLVITVLAGVFKGKADFPKGLAAASLASVPAWVGSLTAPLPFIGILLTLGLAIYSVVLLYRIIPRYLDVPQNYRIAHFAASLVAGFIAFTILSPFEPDFFQGTHEELSRLSSDEPGLSQEFQQAKDTMEAAEDDEYSPPANGQLTEAQVAAYVEIMTEARSLRREAESQMAKLEEKAEDQDNGSHVERFLEGMSGMSTFINLGLAEMKAVKSSGGNWAEHQWIRRQLESARIGRGRDDRTRHNYELYQRYEVKLQSVRS